MDGEREAVGKIAAKLKYDIQSKNNPGTRFPSFLIIFHWLLDILYSFLFLLHAPL